MDLVALQYFQFVAMYRNFSRAAEHFYVGQPTLSRQIANLERDLGVKLLNRDTRNVSLTDAGRVLYDQCDLLLRHHEVIESLVAATKEGQAGQLGIATVAHFGTTPARLVKRFMTKYPRVSIRLDDIPFAELGDTIIHGIYDLAYTLDYSAPTDEAIVQVPVQRDHFVVVAGKDYPEQLPRRISTGQLLDQHLLIPRHVHPPFLGRVRLAARENTSGPGTIEYVTNTETAILRASMGMGVTVVPDLIRQSRLDLTNYQVCELADIDTEYDIVLIHHRDNQRETLRRFLDLITR